ncbi:MAG: site-2 protease family protein [Planctomycetes bacterium]|nr:site-2 protease family protein [Planctomycetota bacterium]
MTSNAPPPSDERWVPEEEYVEAELVKESPVASALAARQIPRTPRPQFIRRRRKRLPLILFLLTCASTFLAGALHWMPGEYLANSWLQQDAMPLRQALLKGWEDGLIYMGCVLAILLMHEMGHFVATLRYRVPASLPFFLPFPLSPIGTMGAVIGMDGKQANRKETFDIGLAGPLAGLAVAVPVMWIGIQNLDLTTPAHGPFALDTPLAVREIFAYASPPGYEPGKGVWLSQVNPYYMAGWVGLLVTGLNMLPVSQLDGGHVIYTVFGKRAHWIARSFMIMAITYIFVAGAWMWSLMVILVLLIGTDHPPTRDDTVPLGWFRIALGLVSLLIPLLCFPPNVFKIVE